MEAACTVDNALDADVDRQLSDARAAAAGIDTRASILVGAAGVTTGLDLAGGSVASGFAVAAAVLGVVLLIPRRAAELPIREAERQFWNHQPVAARRDLMYWKLRVLRARESALKARARLLLLGFALLAVAVFLTAAEPRIIDLIGGGDT